MARARRVGRVARALVAACGEAAPAADPIRSPRAPTWTSRPSFRSAPLARVRAFHSIPFSAASRAAAPTLALVPGAPRLPSRLGDHPARALPTRSYFAGHPQIRNAEGQDMAQVRAGVRLRKALCAVLEHPSMSHRFEGTGLTILEVRMAKDFKKAHVRWTVADGDDDASDEEGVSLLDVWDGHSRDGRSGASSSFSARKRSASAALRREATRLRSMASKMLRSKHTPRLVFVDDDAKSAQERALDAAFDRAAEAEANCEANAAEARAREAEYFASVAQKGSHEPSITYLPHDTADAKRKSSTDDDDRSSVRMGYAFETHDGATPYVSDFVDPDDEGAGAVGGGDDGDGLGDADDGDPAGGHLAAAWEAKVRAATQALRDAEEAWLELGGDAAALDNGGFDADFDDAVDALVEEMAATGDAGADASSEAAIRAAAARARLEAEREDEEGEWFDDDDDEYVEGDEFDDDDDEEAEDFDFDKFDEAERRTR